MTNITPETRNQYCLQGARWTADMDELLLRFALADASERRVEIALQRSPSAIDARLRALLADGSFLAMTSDEARTVFLENRVAFV